MDRRPLKTREKRWVKHLTKALLRTNIQPNQISMSGIFFSVLAGGCLIFVQKSSLSFLYLAAALFIQLRLLCNMMDGIIAIEGNRQAKSGDIFNEVPDRFEDIVILVCAGWVGHDLILGWIAATLAVLTAYIRAFGASLGTKQYFNGPMAKPHRMFVLTMACLLEFFLKTGGIIMSGAMGLIILGCVITCCHRLQKIKQELMSR